MPSHVRSAAIVVMLLPAFAQRGALAQSPQQVHVADALLTAMDFDRVYLGAVSGVLPPPPDALATPASESTVIENPVVQFYRKYAPPAVVRPLIARTYARIFTIEELQEMTVFFSSRAGKKFARHHHEFDREVQGIVLRAGAQHPSELVEAMRASLPRTSATKRPD